MLSRGETLVKRGDTGRNIPACTQCHGEALTGVKPAIPGLLGARPQASAAYTSRAEVPRRSGVPPPGFFDYPQLKLDTTSRALIAPFLADVDTSNPASDEVTYGQTTYNGRRAFCVNWGAVNGVGHFDANVGKRNKFQLILVEQLLERRDRGAGRGGRAPRAVVRRRLP